MAGNSQRIRQEHRGVSWLADKGLIYLATPYTKFQGGQNLAFVEAARLAGALMLAKCSVYSPIAHGHPLSMYGNVPALDHSLWIPFDEAMMRVCDVLLVGTFEGWRDSHGVSYEREKFESAGKPVYLIDPYTMEVE